MALAGEVVHVSDYAQKNRARDPALHAYAALRAGKHVFVEKPHAIDPAGIQVVRAGAALARDRKLSLVSGLQGRSYQGYRETVQRVHEGAIGEIIAIQETWLPQPYVLYPWLPDRGSSKRVVNARLAPYAAQSLHSTSACSSTVCVALSCLSGG